METLLKTYKEILEGLNAQSFNLKEDKYSGVFLPVPSEEYWRSPIKIMLIGRETAGWNTLNHKNTMARALGLIPDIAVEHVVEEAVTRYREHLTGMADKSTSRSRFTQYHFRLARQLSISPLAIVYANMFAWDYDRKAPLLRPCKELQEVTSASLTLLAAQIRHLKPDFVIFACGTRTDRFLKRLQKEHLEGYETLSVIPGKLWEFRLENATCFRIAHPRATHGHPEYREKVIKRIKQAIIRMAK